MINVWNSLEVAKLVVSALTPIVVVVLGIWIARITKRLEQHQWTSRRVIERRIDVYDEIAPLLNDLVVYFTFVGHWKELRPSQLIEAKRLLDRRVHISESLFSESFLSSYLSFIHLCFSTHQGWGVDARLRGDPRRHREAAGVSWDTAWVSFFGQEHDWVDPAEVRFAYQKLMAVLSEELQLGLHSRELPTGRVPGGATKRSRILPDGFPTVTLPSDLVERSANAAVYCRLLPNDLESFASSGERPQQRLWAPGTTLRVLMLGGSEEQRELVQRMAHQWSEYAHLILAFQEKPPAEIRVTFDPSKGSWSYIGTECRQISGVEATMNVASVEQGTVLHLFGLALGLLPEIQNPAGGIRWDVDAIHRDLSDCEEYLPLESVKRFVSIFLSGDLVNGEEFDPASVMMMGIPDDWTSGLLSMQRNSQLSADDKQLLKHLYPFQR